MWKPGMRVKALIAGKVRIGTIGRTVCRMSHGPSKGKVVPGLMTLDEDDGTSWWLGGNTPIFEVSP